MGTNIYLTIIVIMLMGTSIFSTLQAKEETITKTYQFDTLAKIQEEINSQHADWHAGYNTIFTKDESFLQDNLGAILNSTSNPQEKPVPTAFLPSSYDWRDVNGTNYVTSIKNQAGCGSCVGFAAVAALEAVVQIESNAVFDCDLSESQLFFCGGGSCNGGWWPDAATEFIETVGVVDELCLPYESYDMECDQKQINWPSRIIQAQHTGTASENNHIKNALITYGPLLTTFTVYEDFGSYNGGVYEHVWGGVSGGHAVAIVGYNDDPGYWICKNSWGLGWGEYGYFNIKYGECNIDETVYYFDQITGNIQPSKPEIIQPIHGANQVETTIELQWTSSEDIDGNSVTYTIYFNEGYTVDFNREPLATGLTSNTYTVQDLKKETVYSWMVLSVDEDGAQHTDGKYMFQTRKPLAPTIDGPSTIKTQNTYAYSLSASEQEGNSYYWYVNWGDGTTTGWIGPYTPDEQVTVTHVWDAIGGYEIKVKYREDDIESQWGILQITTQKTRFWYPFLFLECIWEWMQLILE